MNFYNAWDMLQNNGRTRWDGFPGSPVVRTQAFTTMDQGSIPSQGTKDPTRHMAWPEKKTKWEDEVRKKDWCWSTAEAGWWVHEGSLHLSPCVRWSHNYYIYACVHALPIQSCLTLGDPTDCSRPGSSVQRILQARVLQRVAMPSRGSSQPGDRTHISQHLLYRQVGSLPLAPPVKSQYIHLHFCLF